MRIVFMGTPDFAAASLSALIHDGVEVAAVYTQPDKARDRGMRESPSPVKELSQAHGIPVCQPEKLREPEALAQLLSYSPELLVVVAYGKLLPDEWLVAAPHGAINLHGSLLPKYRGSAPVQFSVLNGDDVAGVTTMYISHNMDCGDIIYEEETPVGEYETSGELFERLAGIGAALLCKTVRDIEAGTAPREPQNEAEATYTRRLSRDDSPIDWSSSAKSIIKHICGLSPWPAATTELCGATIKVWAAEYTQNRTSKPSGSVVSAGERGIELATGTGETVLLTELQAPGKKRMAAGDWLRGHPLKAD